MVLGANTDSVPTHRAWIESMGGIEYPLISDYDKKISQAYNVLSEEGGGVALRGVFIIDPDGKIQYQLVHNLDIGRNVDEILRVLAALQSGGACPINWEKGDDIIK